MSYSGRLRSNLEGHCFPLVLRVLFWCIVGSKRFQFFPRSCNTEGMELWDAKATTRAVCNVKTSNQFQKSMNVRLTNVNDETAIETTYRDQRFTSWTSQSSSNELDWTQADTFWTLLLTVKSLLVIAKRIHPCYTAAILSRETKRTLFYHAKPRNGSHGDEA